MGLKEVENFKDVEVSFMNHKARDFDTNYSVDEEQDDNASEETEESLPKRSGRKASPTIREETSKQRYYAWIPAYHPKNAWVF